MKKLNYITIAILLFLLGFMYLKYRKQAESSNHKDTIISEKQDSIHHWRTESGRQAIEKVAAEASAKEFKESYSELADELRSEFKVQIKDLKAVMMAEFQAIGKGEGIISNTYNIDSVGRKYREFKMDDGYLKFRTMLFDSLVNSPYEYTYSDTMTYGFVVKKKWLLSSEKLYGFGGMKNPQAKIYAATNVMISSYKDKRFFIGPSVTYGIDGRATIGLSAGWALLRF